MDNIKRQIAYKILIGDLLKGIFIKQEGWEPSFVYLPEKKVKISRVNLMGVAVSIGNKESGFKEMIINDSSASIQLRSFSEELDFKVGDMLNVIGRVREFNGSLYIVPEIVKKYDNIKIKELWDLERKKQVIPQEELKLPVKKVKTETLDESNPKQVIYELIKELDGGDGVEINQIVSKASVDNPELIIENLIVEGEIFKISGSKVKIL